MLRSCLRPQNIPQNRTFQQLHFQQEKAGTGGAQETWVAVERLLFCFQQSYLGLVTHLRTTVQLEAPTHFLSMFYVKRELKQTENQLSIEMVRAAS